MWIWNVESGIVLVWSLKYNEGVIKSEGKPSIEGNE